MTAPVIPADLWLDLADLEEIDFAVDLMVEQLAAGDPPLPAKPVRILDAQLVAGGAEQTMRPRDVRAATKFPVAGKPSIELKPFPAVGQSTEFLAEDLAAFRFAVRPVLAHEAAHVRQAVQGGQAWIDKITAADKASQEALRSNTYQDYMNYLATPIEMAAHATQLAVEVLGVHGGGLDQVEFEKRCGQAWVWRHARDATRWTEGQQTRLPMFIPVATAWRLQAWWLYQRLT
ncbi:hypothetical protein [Caulobacter sp. 602-1]|uniref:hypothetical protein n=1 Tax=Caulobacter sp. 602-1 TaxID=2492472 RepID=UPI000F633B30|nr:hypothetical protein [Caulobacter sp. 602-1]RRN63447.1 hypothetical protein EIK80_16640 [Caulobacter sp. 602-1]